MERECSRRGARYRLSIGVCFAVLVACADGIDGIDGPVENGVPSTDGGVSPGGVGNTPGASGWAGVNGHENVDSGRGGAGTGGASSHGGTAPSAAGGSSAGGSGGTAGSSTPGGSGGRAGSDTPDGSDGDGGSGGGSAPPLTRRTLASGRSFLVHVPTSLNPTLPSPVVLVHHGYNGSAERARQLTRFDTIANEKGFIAVFPEGMNATWNAGLGVCGFGQFVTGVNDDFAFVQAILESLASTHTIDRKRVFATGFSMGGYFANHIGCMRHDLVRGIAPHSGGGPPSGCAAGPMPALIIHGTADTLIWYPCGVQARDAWVAHNSCSTGVDVVPVKGGFCEYNRGCPAGGQVGLCHLDGMGHGWAGTDGTDGGGTQYENISRVIWDFFAKQ